LCLCCCCCCGGCGLVGGEDVGDEEVGGEEAEGERRTLFPNLNRMRASLSAALTWFPVPAFLWFLVMGLYLTLSLFFLGIRGNQEKGMKNRMSLLPGGWVTFLNYAK
jgi:hypothetical protein